MPDQVTVWSMPHTTEQSLNAAQDAATELPADVSPIFKAADTFTAQHEGGVTTNDGNKGTAAFGIDQSAHPNIDVTKITPEHAQAMRYEYWRAIGGDALAKQSPALATAAYDTAIMAGPDRSKQFLAKSGGDPEKFVTQREQFFHQLEAQPAYHGAAVGWENRNRDLRAEIARNKGADHIAQAQQPHEHPKKTNKYVEATPNQRLKNRYT
jgi:lysozyme family protein